MNALDGKDMSRRAVVKVKMLSGDRLGTAIALLAIGCACTTTLAISLLYATIQKKNTYKSRSGGVILTASCSCESLSFIIKTKTPFPPPSHSSSLKKDLHAIKTGSFPTWVIPLSDIKGNTFNASVYHSSSTSNQQPPLSYTFCSTCGVTMYCVDNTSSSAALNLLTLDQPLEELTEQTSTTTTNPVITTPVKTPLSPALSAVSTITCSEDSSSSSNHQHSAIVNLSETEFFSKRKEGRQHPTSTGNNNNNDNICAMKYRLERYLKPYLNENNVSSSPSSYDC